MHQPPRVAFFPDSFREINGVARTSAAFEAFAQHRGYPLLTIFGGGHTEEAWSPEEGGRIQLRRSWVALRIEADLSCDLLVWRHARRVGRALLAFRPDIVHVTGPNDMGQLGAWLAWRLQIPLVASWHTNLHEYAARRLERTLTWLPDRGRQAVMQQVERTVLSLLMRFYSLPHALLAPNLELVDLLEQRTGRQTWLMRRGIDTETFSPARRDVSDDVFRIGYVGRLSPEKNVRLLADLEPHLCVRHPGRFRFVIIGEGSERAWLERRMRHADFPGVLSGSALARAYANMDAFVFPSETDTFGLAVLEALASGVPAIVSPSGGPKSIVETGVSGFVARTAAGYADAIVSLMTDPARARDMGEAARRRARQSSWERTFDTVYHVYGAVRALGTRQPLRVLAPA